MTEKNKKHIGKFLSLVLRHQPEEIDLHLDENGWALVEDLITKSKSKGIIFSLAELEEIVETNDKKRYVFNDSKTLIRANQGHSIDIDLALLPIEPPIKLFHGTAEKNIEMINKEGVKKMNRQYVHLSTDKETAHNVGSRYGKPFIFVINTKQMHDDGIPFYKSENNVWLTDYIDPKYFV